MALPNIGVSVYLTPFVSDSRDIHSRVSYSGYYPAPPRRRRRFDSGYALLMPYSSAWQSTRLLNALSLVRTQVVQFNWATTENVDTMPKTPHV